MSTRRPMMAGVLVSALVVVAPMVSFAADMLTGTWKINLEKSTYSPGPPPKGPNIVKFKSVDNGIQISLAGVNAAGEKTLFEYTVYFDGKEYPVTSTRDGKPSPNDGTITMSGKKIDDYTFETTQTTNGKVIGTSTVVVAKDGKSHVATQTGTNAKGKPVKNVILVEKQ